MVRKALAHTFAAAVGLLFIAGAAAGLILQAKAILGF